MATWKLPWSRSVLLADLVVPEHQATERRGQLGRHVGLADEGVAAGVHRLVTLDREDTGAHHDDPRRPIDRSELAQEIETVSVG